MENNDREEFIARLEYEPEAPCAGWDFSRLASAHRIEESPLPWDYQGIVEDHCLESESVLDIDTGGGEFLSKVKNLPGKIRATEGYAPNIEIARRRLEARGIEVRAMGDDNVLPFENEEFDLVINRHGSYDIGEVKRVLRKGGTFITQQVGGANMVDLNTALGAGPPRFLAWSLFGNIEEFRKNGFTIVACGDHKGRIRFSDIRAVCSFLKRVPWQIGDFSVRKYADRLMMMNEYLAGKGHIDFISHRFILTAAL